MTDLNKPLIAYREKVVQITHISEETRSPHFTIQNHPGALTLSHGVNIPILKPPDVYVELF